METLASILGRSHVMGGVAEISATIAAPAHIRKISPLSLIRFGELDGSRSDRSEKLGSALSEAGRRADQPVLYSRQGIVEKVVKKIGELGEQGVRFATFPEKFVPYYFCCWPSGVARNKRRRPAEQWARFLPAEERNRPHESINSRKNSRSLRSSAC